MKRLLVALLAVSCLGIGLGVAQNINKALQLSQDPSGAFGVDTSNNIYMPNHLNCNSQQAPTVAAAAGTVTVVGCDMAGKITGGSAAATTVTLTFRTAYGVAPICVATAQNPATSPQAFSSSTTALTFTSNIGAAIVDYICIGNRQ